MKLQRTFKILFGNAGDEGRPKNIVIKQSENPNMLEIQAVLEYVQNEHTDYNHQVNYF